MRKINFLKTVLGVAAAMLITTGAFAQTQPPASPYSVFNSNVLNGTAVLHTDSTDYVTFKTGGTTMGYFAKPDPVYHPNYLGPTTSVGTLTADFTWTWTDVAHSGATAPTFTIGTGVLANYTTILYPTLGTYSISAAEKAPAAFGGCTGSSSFLYVSVIDAPTGTASINPGVAWTAITANQAYQICGAQAAQTVTLSFNEAVPNHLASYAFQITETKELLDGTGAVLSTSQIETVVQDFPAASKLKSGNVGTLPSAAFARATPAFTFTFLSDALTVLQNAGVDARTRYTYKVTRTGDAAQNGFFSNISQKSDYISGTVNYYNFTNQTVSFIINPAPVTGPIYYVPNDFNY